MGHNKNVKLLRKQIRNVALEHYQNALTAEAVIELDRRMTDHAGNRLDEIAKNVDKEITKIDNQTREFRKLLMMDASGQISRELFGLNVTMLAWQEELVARLGLDTSDFEAKVQERKKAITERLEAKAKAEYEAQEAAKKEAEAKAAEEAKMKAAEVEASASGESGKPVVVEESDTAQAG